MGMEPEHVVRMGLGWVPQEENIFPSMTVAENLEMGAYPVEGDLKERFAEVSAIFPALEERKRQPAGSLSGGQRQMLAVARGLMLRPDLLLLDEPTAGLDIMISRVVDDLIARLRASDKCILLSTHMMAQAERLCDRIAIIYDGHILACDTLAGLEEKTGAKGMENVFFAAVGGERAVEV